MNSEQREAYLGFVNVTSPRLFSLAWMLTGDRQRAEDLVQETLLQVYLKWRRVRPETAGAYARTILVNLHRQQWRSRGRHERLVEAIPDSESTSPTGSPAEAAGVDIVRALRTLPPRERQAVVLRFYADLSEKDTAAAMGCSVGTVKSASSRGLERLRQWYSDPPAESRAPAAPAAEPEGARHG